MDNKSLLKDTGLFDNLSEEKLDALLAGIIQVTFPEGEVFVHEGDYADGSYVVKDGIVQVFTSNAKNQEIILARLEKGTYFAEQALLTDKSGRRNASVRTVTKTTLLKIRAEYMIDLLNHDAELRTRLLEIGQHQILAKLEAQSASFRFSIDLLDDLSSYETKEFKSGDIIFRQHDKSDFVYGILRGSVDLFVSDETGQEHISTVCAGNFFGELGIIQNQPRFATAVADSSLKVVVITAEKFRQLYNEKPELEKLVDTLSRVYQIPYHGQVIQYIGKFLDMDMEAITSTFRLKDGRQILASRVIGKNISSIHHADISHTKSFSFEQNHIIRRDIYIDDKDRLLGVTNFGQWTALPAVYDMIFKQMTINPEIIEHFTKFGELVLPSNMQYK